MSSPGPGATVLWARGLRKSFPLPTGESLRALDGLSFRAFGGQVTALVGPDGAGKTTLIRAAAGLISPDEGTLEVLGLDITAHAEGLQSRIGYMPQRFGLYEDLTVRENLDLYADLHGVTGQERRERYPRLMEMTALGSASDRLIGRLSGGMKQKLGLACTLVRKPDLLLLDEPTAGVDLLSRRELWKILLELSRVDRLPVVLSTVYLEEAERCGHVVILQNGRALTEGPPEAVRRLAEGKTYRVRPPAGIPARIVQSQLIDEAGVTDAVPEAGQIRINADPEVINRLRSSGPAAGLEVAPADPRFEDGYLRILEGAGERRARLGDLRRGARAAAISGQPAIEVRDFAMRFGGSTIVDHITFEVNQGEIFGLLGPNGAGKTTTFRALCGLLPSTNGTLRVAGMDLRRARAEVRHQVGYVAQLFSLYGQLTVGENLEFFSGAYGLRGARKRDRIGWALSEFDLAPHASRPAAQLSPGYKKRLSMAVGLLHEPKILFLDEPTSSTDLLARREFWRKITALTEQGVTVIVTTHFLEEAEYCDHVAILEAGRLLLRGTPAEIRSRAPAAPGTFPTMEEAFIDVVEKARRSDPENPRGAA